MPTIQMRPATGRRSAFGVAWRAGLLAPILILAACETQSPKPFGTVGHIEGFAGEVVADEPNAARIGEEVLSAGGSAADAAVAVAFTLGVTLPSRASIGGGGMCLVHDNPTQKTEALEFIPHASAEGAGDSTVPVAIPAMPRAMFALQSRFGRLLWEQLLAPAENMARHGLVVNAALGQDLALASGILTKDPEAMRIFGGTDGAVLKDGNTLVQTDLGVLIGTLRTRGVGELYEGMLAPAVARRIDEAAGSANGAISPKDLGDYQPNWMEPAAVEFGDDELYFPPPPSAAGLVAAEMWQMLTLDGRYDKAKADERPHLFVQAALRAFADRGRWYRPGDMDKTEIAEILSADHIKELMASYDPDHATPAASLTPPPVAMPENPAATAFVVIDREGSAVACTLTLNNLFGLGRVARGTGIVLAAAPVKGSASTAMLPFLMTGHGGSETRLAAAAAGGAAAPTSLVRVLLDSVVEDKSLGDAVGNKRIHHGGVPDVVVVEKDVGDSILKSLTDRGYKTFQADSLGDVEATWCPSGVLRDPDSCSAATDPRAHGAAATKIKQ